MTTPRSKMVALVLNMLPGLGHYYWGRRVRSLLYPLLFFGSLCGGFVLGVMTASEGLFVLGVLAAVFFWGISMLDLFIALLREPRMATVYDEYGRPMQTRGDVREETERFYTILLSFIPGLGHFQLGLMQRGLSFLIAFFGLGTFLVFISVFTNESAFLMFLGVLPIIWLYCMFDVVKLVNRKHEGELLFDRSLFEELEIGREHGRRSKMFATLLSVFPGAGQMYLGLQQRGMQLMILFLGSIYILDEFRLSLFLFLIPLIWCYALFDGLQQASRYGREPLEDRPLIKGGEAQRRWLGIGLITLGIYFVFSTMVLPLIHTLLPDWHLDYQARTYLKTGIVAAILIGGGIKLMTGSRQKVMPPEPLAPEPPSFESGRELGK
ncbi:MULTISPECIES: hypothetical protein [Paenibacillus]|uniref:hypothetical protein n=1 Tax=Paenibacillus TaxID=44249 RepID=UPI001E33EE65|nr:MULTISPECIES: hypothetical protein [Paenibacillus]